MTADSRHWACYANEARSNFTTVSSRCFGKVQYYPHPADSYLIKLGLTGRWLCDKHRLDEIRENRY